MAGLYVQSKAVFERTTVVLVSTRFHIMYVRLAAAIVSLDAMSQIRCLQILRHACIVCMLLGKNRYCGVKEGTVGRKSKHL